MIHENSSEMRLRKIKQKTWKNQNDNQMSSNGKVTKNFENIIKTFVLNFRFSLYGSKMQI